MSEKRTPDQIRNDYTGLCAKAGHVQYQIFTLQKDLDLVNATLRDLNLEAAAAANEEAKEKEQSNGA